MTEIRPKFVQCRRCGQWICRDICFNNSATMRMSAKGKVVAAKCSACGEPTLGKKFQVLPGLRGQGVPWGQVLRRLRIQV